MTSDSKTVKAVRFSLARRQPSELVALMLEFANWGNHEQKEACMMEFDRFSKIIPEIFLPSHGVIFEGLQV
jgi:hypothetical protein